VAARVYVHGVHRVRMVRNRRTCVILVSAIRLCRARVRVAVLFAASSTYGMVVACDWLVAFNNDADVDDPGFPQMQAELHREKYL